MPNSVKIFFISTILLFTFSREGGALEPGHPRPEFLSLHLSAKLFLNKATVQNGKVVSANFIYILEKDKAKCKGQLGSDCFELINKGLPQEKISGATVELAPEIAKFMRGPSELTSQMKLDASKLAMTQNLAIAIWTPFSNGWNNVAKDAEFNKQISSYQDTAGVFAKIESLLIKHGQLKVGGSSPQQISLKVSPENELDVDLILSWWERQGSASNFKVTAQVLRLHKEFTVSPSRDRSFMEGKFVAHHSIGPIGFRLVFVDHSNEMYIVESDEFEKIYLKVQSAPELTMNGRASGKVEIKEIKFNDRTVGAVQTLKLKHIKLLRYELN